MPTPARAPRVIAWTWFAFGLLVVIGGLAGWLQISQGPKPNGCAGMVSEVWALILLVLVVIVGLPHLIAPLLFLRWPRRGRKVFLVLVALDVLASAVYSLMFAWHGPRGPLACWIPLTLITLAAFVVMRREVEAGT